MGKLVVVNVENFRLKCMLILNGRNERKPIHNLSDGCFQLRSNEYHIRRETFLLDVVTTVDLVFACARKNRQQIRFSAYFFLPVLLFVSFSFSVFICRFK